MTESTTMVANNVFRSTRLFGNGSSNLVLFSLQLGALMSYVTDHTAIVGQVGTNLDPFKTLD